MDSDFEVTTILYSRSKLDSDSSIEIMYVAFAMENVMKVYSKGSDQHKLLKIDQPVAKQLTIIEDTLASKS